MATDFWGMAEMEFSTDKDIDFEKLEKFKDELETIIEDTWETTMYDLASKHGFEIDTMHPVMLCDSYPIEER
jgi:hypothetical protein